MKRSYATIVHKRRQDSSLAFCVNTESFIKLPASIGTIIGDLWEIYGLSVAFYKRTSIIILQKSSARKGGAKIG